MQIGFHTDAFNSSYWNFDKCLAWAEANGVHFIECGLIDGVSWIHGLGYQPHIALYQDPLLLRRKMERMGVQFSQLDAAYPLSGSDGPLYGVPYVLKSIPWAKLAGCPRIATTDGLHRPEGLNDDEAMELMKRSYGQIVEVGEAYEITVNIEVHGYFTTNPDRLAQMLARAQGKLIHRPLTRVSPLAVPILLEIGRETVYGEAQDAILAEAAKTLVDEVLDERPPVPRSLARRAPAPNALAADLGPESAPSRARGLNRKSADDAGRRARKPEGRRDSLDPRR